jgi:hypothetical protein
LTDPKRIVASGYDAIADRYNEWAESFETPEHVWLRKLLARIKPGGEMRHVVSAGFEVEDACVVPFEEPGHGVASFMWVLARRPP